MKDLMCNQYDKIEELGHTDNEFFKEYFRLYNLLPLYSRILYNISGDDTQAIYLKAIQENSWIENVIGIRKAF